MLWGRRIAAEGGGAEGEERSDRVVRPGVLNPQPSSATKGTCRLVETHGSSSEQDNFATTKRTLRRCCGIGCEPAVWPGTGSGGNIRSVRMWSTLSVSKRGWLSRWTVPPTRTGCETSKARWAPQHSPPEVEVPQRRSRWGRGLSLPVARTSTAPCRSCLPRPPSCPPGTP